MPFGNNVKSLFLRRPPAVPKAGQSDAFAGLVSAANMFAAAPPSTAGLIEYYNQSPSVRAIVSRIGDACARQRWYVENIQTGEKDYTHPAACFIRKGCTRLRGRAALRMTITHRDLAGECFWVIGRGPRGVPASYAPIPSTWVVNVPTGAEADGGVYEIQVLNGMRLTLPAADVLWLRDPDPANPFGRGKGGLTGSAATEIATDEAAADYLSSFFKNYARPDLIVSGTEKAPLSNEDMPAFKRTWIERFRSVSNAGLPFFTAREIKVQPVGSSLKDNNLAELRKDLRQVLREVYGVPPEILGVVENSNRATIDAADYLFAHHTVDPRLSWLQDEIETFLRTEFGLKDTEALGYDSPIAEDKEFALKIALARPSAVSRNELRNLAGLREVEDPAFDAFPDDPAPVAQDNPKDGPKDKPKSLAKSLSASNIVDVAANGAVSAEFGEIMKELFEKMVRKYGKALLRELEAEATFAVNLEVASWLASKVPELLGQIDTTTVDALKSSLVTGTAANETVAQLVARVEAVFAEAIDLRAPLIGQTVATQLAGFTSLAAAKQAGFEKKQWLTTGDTAVRSSHNSLNGQVRELADKFRTSGGHEALHPGGFGVASEDVNCRCAIRPVLDGEEVDDSKKSLSPAEFEDFHVRQCDVIAGRFRSNMVKAFKAQRSLTIHAINTYSGI